MAARIASLLIVAGAAVGVVAGCALAGGAPNLPSGTRECVGFPAEVCQRQVQELEKEGATHGGVVAYRIVCTPGICTLAQGEGTQTVVFGDGTGREGGFGYAVPAGTPSDGAVPPLPVTPTCLGVPQSWCEDFARNAADEAVRGGQSVVTIAVRCTTSCTGTNGDVEVRVTLGDGTVVTSTAGYRS
jgi:hypothetical protein